MTTTAEEKANVAMNGYEQMGMTASEDAGLVNAEPHELPLETAVQFRRGAIIVSWVSIVVTFCLATGTFVIAVLENSSSSFAFGFDALLDCVSSVVVIWRYHGSAAKSLYSSRRERKACIVLGALFIVSFCLICGKSIESLADRSHPARSWATVYVALVNAVVCLILMIIKFYLGKKLESVALVTDGFNSLIGSLMGGATFVSAFIYERNRHVWYVDDLVGMVCAVFLLGYGIKLLVTNLRKDKKET